MSFPKFRLRSIVLVLAIGAALAGSGLTAGCVARNNKAAVHAAHRSTLAEHRQQQITRLHTYAEAGVFPINPIATPAPVHIFKDAAGTRCAVANLVYLDGLGEVVDRMALTHNDVVVADETSGPLHDWVLTSGLTNEEVRRIQGVGFDFNGEPGGLVWLDRSNEERVRVQTQLREAERELVANTETSLDVAANRLNGSRVAMR